MAGEKKDYTEKGWLICKTLCNIRKYNIDLSLKIADAIIDRKKLLYWWLILTNLRITLASYTEVQEEVNRENAIRVKSFTDNKGNVILLDGYNIKVNM